MCVCVRAYVCVCTCVRACVCVFAVVVVVVARRGFISPSPVLVGSVHAPSPELCFRKSL